MAREPAVSQIPRIGRFFGAETGNRRDKVVPERSWIEGAVKAFQDKGKPVFMKDSMKPVWGKELLTEFPWED